MAFAAGHDDVAGFSERTRKCDRRAAIRHAPEIDTFHTALREHCSRGDFHDFVERLGARIFRGQNDSVGGPTGHLTHQGPFLAVAQAGTAEHDNHLPIGHRARGGDGSIERVRRVCKVYNRREVLAFVDAFHAAGNAFQRGDPLRGNFRRDQNFFDFNLLANPLNPPTSSPAVPVVNSPHEFQTRRRMSDFDLTVLPLSRISFRLGYSRNNMTGPSFSSFHEGTDVLLSQPWDTTLNSYRFGVDFKFLPKTAISYDQYLDYYRGDTSWHLAPFSTALLPGGTTMV